MKITFIRPDMFGRRSSDALEPLCFAALLARTPAGVETVLYDERVEPVPTDEPTDLAALTVCSFSAQRAYAWARHYRERGIPVVAGGYHPTLAPDEVLEHVDAVVTGDGEEVWPQVVEDAREGRLRTVYRGGTVSSPAACRFERDLFRGKRYAPMALVQYGRGCPRSCDFCSVHAFYGSDIRHRPVRAVTEELERLGRRLIFFVDDNLFAGPARARELLEALVPLRTRWTAQVSVDVARDPALVRLMARSGCESVLVGFESLDRDNLRQMGKAWNLEGGDYEDALAVFRDEGIMVYGTFVFGYDHDTVDAFDRAVEFALRHRLLLANFNPLTPFPGTALFDRLSREGRLLHDRWWLAPDYRYGHAAFTPRGMSADELTEGCYRARTAFHRYSSMARRLADPRTHLKNPNRLGAFVLSNLISRREVHAKQDQPLGGERPVPMTTHSHMKEDELRTSNIEL